MSVAVAALGTRPASDRQNGRKTTYQIGLGASGARCSEIRIGEATHGASDAIHCAGGSAPILSTTLSQEDPFCLFDARSISYGKEVICPLSSFGSSEEQWQYLPAPARGRHREGRTHTYDHDDVEADPVPSVTRREEGSPDAMNHVWDPHALMCGRSIIITSG